MPSYAITTDGYTTAAVAGQFKTALAINNNDPNMAPRLEAVRVGAAREAPADEQITLRVMRADGTIGSGTSATPSKKDPDSHASGMIVVKNHTVEPAILEPEPLVKTSFNARDGCVLEWQDGDQPEWNKADPLIISLAPGTNNARKVSVTAEWTE